MNILVVDDSRGARRELVKNLRREPKIKDIFEADNGLDALRTLSSKKVDLVITDIVMPKMDGFKLIQGIKSDERFDDIPIVLLSVRSRLDDRVKGLELGASDFLVKPVHPVELSARVRAMLRVKVLQDNLRNRLKQLEHLSVIDGLTGLYNKNHLITFLSQEVIRTKRFRHPLSCLMVDIDDFKKINDTHGHIKGDQVLKEIGDLMGELIRGYDFAARYGGDEFTLVLPQQDEKDGAMILAERLRKTVEKKFFLKKKEGGPIRITISIGIFTLQPEGRESCEEVMEKADKALYEAKTNGRNRVVSL